jgi:hypothetical protein
MQRSEFQAGPNQAVVVYSPADTGSEIDPVEVYSEVAADAAEWAAKGWRIVSTAATPTRPGLPGPRGQRLRHEDVGPRRLRQLVGVRPRTGEGPTPDPVQASSSPTDTWTLSSESAGLCGMCGRKSRPRDGCDCTVLRSAPCACAACRRRLQPHGLSLSGVRGLRRATTAPPGV